MHQVNKLVVKTRMNIAIDAYEIIILLRFTDDRHTAVIKSTIHNTHCHGVISITPRYQFAFKHNIVINDAI